MTDPQDDVEAVAEYRAISASRAMSERDLKLLKAVADQKRQSAPPMTDPQHDVEEEEVFQTIRTFFTSSSPVARSIAKHVAAALSPRLSAAKEQGIRQERERCAKLIEAQFGRLAWSQDAVDAIRKEPIRKESSQ